MKTWPLFHNLNGHEGCSFCRHLKKEYKGFDCFHVQIQRKICFANKYFLSKQLLSFYFATDVMPARIKEELNGEHVLCISIQRCEMHGWVHSLSRRSQNQEYICKSRRSHLNFLLNFESYFQVLTFCTDNIRRAEYCVLEDLPKVADFCPKKQTEKDLEASASVCAGWAGTNYQAQFVVPLHLEWELTMVHFNSCRRWAEEACHHSSIQCFLSVQSIWKQDEPFS